MCHFVFDCNSSFLSYFYTFCTSGNVSEYFTVYLLNGGDVTKPTNADFMCKKSIGCGCRFVARLKLVPATIATAIQLS